jgi:putative ABC transport system permease protein
MIRRLVSLAAANLLHRKTRTAVAVVAVGVSVASAMLLVGLARGTLDAIAHRLENVGADVLLQPPDASLILGVTSAVMPLALMDRIREVGDVTAVTPVLNWHVSQLRGEPESLNLWAVDPSGFSSLSGGLDLVAGRSLEGPGELVVDSILARQKHLEIGEHLEMLGREFVLVGVSRPGSGGRVFARIQDIGEAIGSPGKASFFLVKGRDSRLAGDLTERLQKRFAGYKVTAIAQVSKAVEDNAVGLRELEGAVTLLALLISFLVVFLAMYTAIMERTREIGILRALGATPVWVIRATLIESSLICAFGVLAGWLLALVGRYGLEYLYPAQHVAFTAAWSVAAASLALLSGIVGSIYPALRAARLDPIQALSAE